ncbi:MAG: 6-bladed beta-propeller [Rudaea sp.]
MLDHRISAASATQACQRKRQAVAACLVLIAALCAHPASAQTYRYLGTIGTSGPGTLDFPNDVQIDPVSHHLVVTDANNNRVVVFNSAGTYLTSFGSGGTGNGQFDYPAGIGIDPASQDVFVADYYNHRVQQFDASGNYLGQFAIVDDTTPCGIVIQPTSHNIVVSTGYGASVQRYSPALSYLDAFGSSTNFGYACDMRIAPNGNILVSDETVYNVQIFSASGSPLGTFGSYGSGNGQFGSPNGIAIEPGSGNIVVVDSGNNRIEIFDSSGNYLNQFGSYGSAPGQFNVPVGAAIDTVSHHLFVDDRGNNRIQEFAACGSTPVSLSVLPQTQQVNQAILFSASIGNAISPSGTVSMLAEDGSLVCTATTYGDPQAACSGYIQLGVHTVSAAYSGDAVNPSGCSQATTVAVVTNTMPTATTVALVGPPNGINQGDVFTLDATVSFTSSPGSANPANVADTLGGFVTFMDGSNVLANVPLNGNEASYSNRIIGGAHQFSAIYSGDGGYASASGNSDVSASVPADDIFYDSFEVPPGE